MMLPEQIEDPSSRASILDGVRFIRGDDRVQNGLQGVQTGPLRSYSRLVVKAEGPSRE